MGLFSKIIKGIKNIVKGVAKVIKKTVKGVAKVVKKVAKSKIFKAILIAAAIYVTGGAAAGAFGSTGAWATSVSNLMASGTWASTLATPFAKLGTALGTGARGVSDFVGFTTKGAKLGAGSITGGASTYYDPVNDMIIDSATGKAATTLSTYYDPVNDMIINSATGKAVTQEEIFLGRMAKGNIPSAAEFDAYKISRGETWQKHAANIAKEQGVGPTAVAAAPKTRSKFVKGLGSWASNVTGSVASGYILNELQGEDPAGAMFAGDIEGKRYFDPLQIYDMDGRPLDINSVYENLLYGNIDPFAAKDPLYTQATIPA